MASKTLDVHPLTYVRRVRGLGKLELARRMQQLGAEMGVPLATNRTQVWRWEHGQSPDVETQRVLARLLDVPETALSAGWPYWLPAWELPVLAEPWTHDGAVAVLTHLNQTGSMNMDRRGFLTITGTALTGVAASWAASGDAHAQVAEDAERLNHDGPVDAGTIEALERRVDTLRTLDDNNGGARVLSLARADLNAITLLLSERSHGARIRQQLYSLAAQVAYLAGWMAHDAGLRSQGQSLGVTALRSAREAGDDALGAYVLAELAVMAAESGEYQEAEGMVDTAADRSPVGSGDAAWAYLHLQQASARARTGDRAGAARSLASAQSRWERVRPQGDVQPWLAWFGTADLASGEARVLEKSGDYAGAVAALQGAVSSSAPRDQAVRAGRLATVYLGAGQVDAAVESAERSMCMLEGAVVSRRAEQYLGAFVQEAGERGGAPVRDLGERLAALNA